MKKVLTLALACAMAVSITACGSNTTANDNSKSTQSVSESTEAKAESSQGEAAGLTEAFAESPILLTSGGQSADYQMIGTVMGKKGMDYRVSGLATSADIGDAKTLIVVIGGSSKGLGAAGIDEQGEIARLDELITAAKDAGLSVIAMHTGGQPRRGDLSDKFIAPVLERADYAIIVADGDKDGLMSGICADKGIPVDEIDSISDVATVLPAAFK